MYADTFTARQAGQHRSWHQRHPRPRHHARQHALIGLNLHHTAHRRPVAGVPGLKTGSVRTALAEGEHLTALHVLGAGDGWMIQIADHHQLLFTKLNAIEPGQFQRAVHQRRIQTPGEQTFEQFPARRRLHVQVHCRVGAVVAGQQSG